MRRLLAALLLVPLAACGVQPSGVDNGPDAPTGIAPGITLYFLDAQDRLRPEFRRTGNLGSIAEAVSLLLTGPGSDGLRTGIATTPTTRVYATTGPGLVTVRLPLARYEVSEAGVDQVVCTALGVHVQGGGSAATKVQVDFTIDNGPNGPRTCPR
ncbi:hypothetical protein JOF53_007264 [Crossiella equi]|uniref:GerMN domain-containing protein n=1 Tax=Crossiella equi TaxID=130796 RepID=A0ABS5APQ8_9PSEU|nr:hypothetical protein [Crossiella equi]MBP2478392.1 hypothetical protein [Crossiella equi]